MGDYDLAQKITRYLKTAHGVDALVTGTTVSAAGFLEKIEGVVTKAKLDDLGERIKRRLT